MFVYLLRDISILILILVNRAIVSFVKFRTQLENWDIVFIKICIWMLGKLFGLINKPEIEISVYCALADHGWLPG